MGLDDFLEQQRDHGTEDSEGVFTMAVKEASWKLQDYLLTTPRMFPVYLLSSAVAGGASYLRITRSGKTDIFKFDGEAYTLEELKLLSLPMLGSSAPQKVRDIGVVFSVAGNAGKLRFISDEGERGLELNLSSERELTVSERDNPKPRHGQSLIINYDRDPISLEKLEEMGRLAPIEVSLNGTQIRNVDDLGMSEYRLYAHYLQDGTEPLMVRQARLCEYSIASIQKKITGRSMAVGLCWPAFATHHGWLFISNGVAYQLPQNEHSFPFACGVVAASDLPRDLSGSGFIRGEAYDKVWKEIDDAVEELLSELLTSKVDISANHRELLNQELETRYTGRPKSPNAAAYLASQETLDAPLDNLQAAGALARQTGEWEKFELLLGTLRKRASLAYGYRTLRETVSWLKREREALLSAQIPTHEVDSLVRFVTCLLEGLETPSQEATFRDTLSDLRYSNASELPTSEAPPPWTAPLYLLLQRLDKSVGEPKEVTPNWSLAFSIWEACEGQNFSLAWKLVDRCPSLETSRVWRHIVFRLYRGQMSFLRSTRWGINCHFESTFQHGAAERRALRLLPDKLRRWEEVTPILREPHLGDVYLPLVMSRLICLTQSGQGEAALNFLGKVLLQCSILREGLLQAKELPRLDDAFPPGRFYPHDQ